MNSRRTIFVDKDGTLVPDIPYNVQPERITLARGAVPGLRSLVRAGFQLVVISNQSGVARGLFGEQALSLVEQRIRELLNDADIPLAGCYFCPHHPDGIVQAYAVECDCRKPKPGLLLRAARELGVALADSWMIGDILDDVEAAHLAGCRAVLLVNGSETQWRLNAERRPDAVAADLEEAAMKILSLGQTPFAVSLETVRV